MPEYNLDLYATWDELNSIDDDIDLMKNGGVTNWQSLSIPEDHNASGIYAIKDALENRLYIGKATDFETRRKAHYVGRGGDSERLHNAINSERIQNGDEGVANRFFWCRLLNLPKDNDILNKKEIEQIAKYNTYENKWHYNLTPGGDGGGAFKYQDRPEIYNIIAQLLADGKTEKYIHYIIKRDYDVDIPAKSIISDMYKNPKRYSKYIDKSLIKYDDSGKAYLRDKTYRTSNILNLYYYDQNLTDEEILADVNFEKALGKAGEDILNNTAKRKLIWRAAINNKYRSRNTADGYKWIGEVIN